MIAGRFFGHSSPTTGMVENRLQRAGVVVSVCGENVAQADSPDDAHRVLMDSPAHRANVLAPQACDVGVGRVVTQGAQEQLRHPHAGRGYLRLHTP